MLVVENINSLIVIIKIIFVNLYWEMLIVGNLMEVFYFLELFVLMRV